MRASKRGVHTCALEEGSPYQSNVIIRNDVPNRLPRGSRLHLGNSVFVCRGISWIRLFSLSLPPGEIVCKSFPSPHRLQTNAGSWRRLGGFSFVSGRCCNLTEFMKGFTDPSMWRNRNVCFHPNPKTQMSGFNGRSTCCLMHVINILHFCWIFFPGWIFICIGARH